jgi:hypothetical protein
MPAPHKLQLDLRPATLDDVEIVADLEATRDPEDPHDPQMLRFWSTRGSVNEVHVRTSNDGANAPILHLNQEMGYQLVAAAIELHRELGPPGARRAPNSP